MRVIEFLNNPDHSKFIKQLYELGMITLKTRTYPDIYNQYSIELKFITLEEKSRPNQKPENIAVFKTSQKLDISEGTVRNAIKEMEKEI